MRSVANNVTRRTCSPEPVSPEFAQIPEILVVTDGLLGGRLLKQIHGHDHLSVYWPGRGEMYIASRAVARITVLSGGDRLDPEERRLLQNKLQVWGDRALWVEG